jgi:hypothetical protein
MDNASPYIVLVHGGDWEWPDVFGPFADQERAEAFYQEHIREDTRVESWTLQPLFNAGDLPT